MIGGIKERTVSNKKTPTAPSPGRPTGFPRAEHRSKKSAFLQNRQKANVESIPTDPSSSIPLLDPRPLSQASNPAPSLDDNFRDEISVQNAQRMQSMSEEQIEQDRQDILARFGTTIADRLRRAREAQARKAVASEWVHFNFRL